MKPSSSAWARWRWPGVLAVVAAVVAVAAVVVAPVSDAAPATARPDVVVLASVPGSGLARVLRLPVGGDAPGKELGRLRMRDGDAVARARLTPAGVVAVLDVDKVRGDGSWAAHLVRLAGGQVTTLARGVYSGSWPVVAGGAVLVARGAAGPVLERDVRVDTLAVDEVDVASGKSRELWRGQGWLALPVGVVGGEAVLYRVGPEGAALLAVTRDGKAAGRVREIARVFPMARDFRVDGGALVYLNRDDRDAALWVVDRVEVATGARTRLWSSPHYGMAPVMVGGRLWVNAGVDEGVALAGDRVAARAAVAAARAVLGPGQDDFEVGSTDGRWLGFLRWAPPGAQQQFPLPWVLDATTGARLRVAMPAGERVELVGFVQ